MLYCHYEQQTINVSVIAGLPATPLNITKLQFSTDRYYGNVLAGRSGWDMFKNIKDNLIKQIPASNRDYDPQFKIWTIHTKSYEILRKLIEHTYDWKVEFMIHDDLEEFLTGANRAARKNAPKAEDFFYNYGQPIATPALTLDDVQRKLTDLIMRAVTIPSDNWIGLSPVEKTKIYKRVAMKWHPDLPTGDKEKMTELNYLWQTYKEMTKI